MASAELSQITGDIAASADVTIHTKGGSVTATLKKALRDRLGTLKDHHPGAALQFANGQSVVLLVGASDAPRGGAFRVHRINSNRFEIVFEDESEPDVDPVTAAFLHLKSDQFRKGVLRLSEPMTAEDWRQQTDRDFGEVAGTLSDTGQSRRAR
jgi:hypothetical protein